LNGSHSMLAYAGSIRGHSTIDEAIADPACRSWVEMFWDEASRHLTLPASDIAAYREALLTRFSNPRARDQLARIAADGSTKLLVRTVPTIRAERAAGRVPIGCATTVAAWILHLRGLGAPIKDAGAAAARDAANSGELPEVIAGVLDALEPGLGAYQAFLAAVLDQANAIQPPT
jgi:fructuronate reductase